MNPLTIQILVKNNESTIEECLNSILDLDCQLLIGDFGCSDRTIEICKKHKAEVYPLSLNNNFHISYLLYSQYFLHFTIKN